MQRLHSQGALETTNRPLDLAIENEGINGDGFFQVSLPDGSVAYASCVDLSSSAGSFCPTAAPAGAAGALSTNVILPAISPDGKQLYAVSWALTVYLQRTRGEQFAAYLRELAGRPVGVEISAALLKLEPGKCRNWCPCRRGL